VFTAGPAKWLLQMDALHGNAQPGAALSLAELPWPLRSRPGASPAVRVHRGELPSTLFTRLRNRKADIRKDPDARAFVRSVADGNETVPTVVVAGRALVNPSRRQLLGVVRANAPHAPGAGR
jgi:hypothetical protein